MQLESYNRQEQDTSSKEGPVYLRFAANIKCSVLTGLCGRHENNCCFRGKERGGEEEVNLQLLSAPLPYWV